MSFEITFTFSEMSAEIKFAFAALKNDGSVVSWGEHTKGGELGVNGYDSQIAASLNSGVSEIFSTYSAFTALKSDGSVISWGASNCGGQIPNNFVPDLSSNVATIFSRQVIDASPVCIFVALKDDGSIISWGKGAVTLNGYGGNNDFSSVRVGAASTAALRSLVVCAARHLQVV